MCTSERETEKSVTIQTSLVKIGIKQIMSMKHYTAMLLMFDNLIFHARFTRFG